MFEEGLCKISSKSDQRFRSYGANIIRIHFFAAKVKWSVLTVSTVFRKRYVVSRSKLVCMHIGMFSDFGINFVKIHKAVQKICTLLRFFSILGCCCCCCTKRKSKWREIVNSEGWFCIFLVLESCLTNVGISVYDSKVYQIHVSM